MKYIYTHKVKIYGGIYAPV